MGSRASSSWWSMDAHACFVLRGAGAPEQGLFGYVMYYMCLARSACVLEAMQTRVSMHELLLQLGLRGKEGNSGGLRSQA
jgi:hypothetical protein